MYIIIMGCLFPLCQCLLSAFRNGGTTEIRELEESCQSDKSCTSFDFLNIHPCYISHFKLGICQVLWLILIVLICRLLNYYYYYYWLFFHDSCCLMASCLQTLVLEFFQDFERFKILRGFGYFRGLLSGTTFLFSVWLIKFFVFLNMYMT